MTAEAETEVRYLQVRRCQGSPTNPQKQGKGTEQILPHSVRSQPCRHGDLSLLASITVPAISLCSPKACWERGRLLSMSTRTPADPRAHAI